MVSLFHLFFYLILPPPPPHPLPPLFGCEKVDSEAHAALAGMFDVKGYPTLKWLPKGKTTPADTEVVKAPRTADGLAKFITDKTGVAATTPAQVSYVYMYIGCWYCVTPAQASYVTTVYIGCWYCVEKKRRKKKIGGKKKRKTKK